MKSRYLRQKIATAVAAALAGLLAAWPAIVSADAGPPPAPHSIWTAWSLQPLTIAALTLPALFYVHGLDRLWRRAGIGAGVCVWQAQCFIAAVIVLAIALISPLDGLSQALFSAHMVQHLLLILVVAPLLVLGAPSLPFLFALPRCWRKLTAHGLSSGPVRQVRRFAGSLEVAWTVSVATLWIWHVPLLYEAALRNQAIHAAEHLCLLAGSALFWQAFISRVRRGPGQGFAVAAALAMGVQSTILGIALTFSPAPWYPTYAASAGLWGISPLADQQLAGLVMWIPAGAVYLGTALFVLARLIANDDGPDVQAKRAAAVAAPVHGGGPPVATSVDTRR